MNERSIFMEALAKDTPDQRAAYLDEACASDAALRQRMETLLASHVEADSFLGTPVVERLAAQIATDAGMNATCANALEGADHSLRFLGSSDKPGSLGRLDNYEIEEVLGRGGMGIVLRAFDEKLHRVVAIKVMAAPLASNEHARRRFVREGRAAAAIRDDHVIGIHGVDETNGLPFLVMEYVVGRSLAQRIEAEGPLPLAEILRIGGQIARGLTAAHGQGVVHRDIKPANILLENGVERVKITDFGLAHAVDDVRTTLPGTVIGTPEYMSPEQARGERVDHRSDIFSLGCVLYAMCAGRPPFRADSTVAIIRRVCDDTPRPLVEINSEIPEWLVDLIDKLIAKEASERFQSAAEVAELLSQYLAHVQQPAINPQPAAITKPRPVRRNNTANARRGWSIAAAAVLLLCAGLALAESTGVTNVAATVIRIVRGDGTLVVELDDPNIQVLVDGEELVITGAGPKEIRLRPGQHELHTVKDGKPVETKLITITKGGRDVVKVAREAVAAAAPASPTTRLVWAEPPDWPSPPSPDGRYLAVTDWDTGDLAVRDLATGKNRRVTNIGVPGRSNGFAMGSRFSADGKQLAFVWFYKEDKYDRGDLRVVPVDGGEPRVVYKDKNKEPGTCGWTPDGKSILVSLFATQERQEIAFVGVADGSVRTVKPLDDWRKAKVGQIRLSPDGKTIAYHRLAEPASTHREIFLIDAQSGQETQVTAHATDKQVLDWTADGHLLYDMERQGARDAWLLRVADGKPQGEARFVKKDLGTISPLGITTGGTLYYGSKFREPTLFTATLDLEKGATIATPLAAEKFNILDQLFLNDWSPDGEHLAYSAGSQRALEMKILSIKTGQMRAFNLAPDAWINRFRWSLDGRSFIGPSRFVDTGSGWHPGIDQIDAVSGQATTVVEGGRGSRPVWSHDGRGIFYSAGRVVPGGAPRILRRDLDTRMESDVLPSGNAAFDGMRGFSYEPSPDGRYLALLSASTGEPMVLWLVPLDGAAPRELFHSVSAVSRVSYSNPYRALSWTPDSKYILFKRGGDEAQSGLWFISADGGEPRKLTISGLEAKKVMDIAIHPDGKQLALAASASDKSEVWALENFLPPLADSKPSAAADPSAASLSRLRVFSCQIPAKERQLISVCPPSSED